jgi:hypothetical protein
VARRVTVLDWADIRILVEICAFQIPANSPKFEKLEAARHDLVNAFLMYMKEWLPGETLDDELRIAMVEALKKVEQAAGRSGGDDNQRGPMSTARMAKECARIAGLLRAAMNDSNSRGLPHHLGMLLLLAVPVQSFLS